MPVTYKDGVYVGTPDDDSIFRDLFSQYQARVDNPRTLPNGTPLDTPDEVKKQLIDPWTQYISERDGARQPSAALLRAQNPWSNPILAPGGEVLQVNRATGDKRVIQPGSPGMSKQEEIKMRALLNEKGRLMSNKMLSYSADLKKQLADINTALEEYGGRSSATPAPQEPAPSIGGGVSFSNPFSGANFSTDLGSGSAGIGTPNPNAFSVDPFAAAAQGSPAPDSRVRVRKAGKIYSLPASQLESAKKQGYTPVE